MEISTKGRTCIGRWYPRPDRYVIFVNQIAKIFDPNTDDVDFDSFIAEFLATEFHELGHIISYRNGCKTDKCSWHRCYWCEYTSNIIFLWFLFEGDENKMKNVKLSWNDKLYEIKRWT